MKRFTLPLAALVLFAFAACDNNKNETPAPNFAEEIAGTYNGYSTASFFGSVYATYENQSIVITANTNGTVDLSFTDSTNEEWRWGEYKLTGLAVTKSGDTYKIAGDGEGLYLPSMSGGEPSGPYDYTMEGNIVSKTSAEFTFVIPAVMSGVTIKFITGTAPEEE